MTEQYYRKKLEIMAETADSIFTEMDHLPHTEQIGGNIADIKLGHEEFLMHNKTIQNITTVFRYKDKEYCITLQRKE